MVMLRHLYDILGIIEVMFFNFHTLRATYHLRVGTEMALQYGTYQIRNVRAHFFTGGHTTYTLTNVHAYLYIFPCTYKPY